MKFRRIAVFWAVTFAVLSAAVVLYRLTYQSVIRPKLSQLKHIKIVTKPESLDTVILRNGLIFEGRILAENTRGVVMRLYFEGGGEGQMNFRRAEISQIKYREKE